MWNWNKQNIHSQNLYGLTSSNQFQLTMAWIFMFIVIWNNETSAWLFLWHFKVDFLVGVCSGLVRFERRTKILCVADSYYQISVYLTKYKVCFGLPDPLKTVFFKSYVIFFSSHFWIFCRPLRIHRISLSVFFTGIVQ